MKIMRIVGARPQFMQLPALSAAFSKKNWTEHIIHTGQHYDAQMSRVFFDELGLKMPTINLNVGSDSHASQTAQMMIKIEEAVNELRPDIFVVDGDTNSTLASALVATKLTIPIVHVESGVRCGIKHQPEEKNRIITDHISDLLCMPAPSAAKHLKREGLIERARMTGDVMLDCFMSYSKAIKPFNYESHKIQPGKFCLVTMHRAETTSDYETFEPYLRELNDLSLPCLFPTHPRLSKLINRFKETHPRTNIRFVEPVSYLTMLGLIRESAFIVTDSGGVTREGPFSGKSVVLASEATAWSDLVDKGYVVKWDPAEGDLASAVKNLKTVNQTFVHEIFGNGEAASKIVFEMEKFF